MNGPYEIERKYLIEYPNISELMSISGCKKADITQTYLVGEIGETERVRRSETVDAVVYTHTRKKYVNALRRVEIENEITETEYDELRKKADNTKSVIRKTRYTFCYCGQCFEVDVYPFWTDKAIVETELDDESTTVEFPPQIRIIKEVTDDKRYSNYSLATQYK